MLFASACGGDPADSGAPSDPGGAGAPASPDPGGAGAPGGDGSSGSLPDEQVLCGAVDEAPVVAALGAAVENRGFHGPSGASQRVTCNWETVTKSVTVQFYEWPSFRTLVDDDIFAEYGEGEFDGLGVEAHRSVYRGLLIDSPRGWAIELAFAGTIHPSDEELTALARAAMAAADST
jgi:hypothetical protein